MTTFVRPCPVCAENETRPVLKKDAQTLVKCGHCGMVFTNPVPQAYLDGTFYEDSGRSFYLSPEKLAGDYSPVRFERETAFLRSHCQRGRVLDVGCSSGAFLFQLRSRFPGEYEVLGTDVSGPPLDYAESQGVPVLRGNFLTHDFGAVQFDAVTFWAVLEHVADPAAFVHQAWKILKPGGWCFILVPNFDSLAVRLLQGKYRYILPQHLNYFSRATLVKMSCPPFIERSYTSMHFNPLVLVRDAFQRDQPDGAERSRLLVRTNAWKQRPGMLPLRLLYRGSERALRAFNLADNCALALRRV